MLDRYQGHGKDRFYEIVDGNTAPRVVIDNNGVWIDGEPLPLIVADKPVTVTSDGVVSEVSLTLMTAGPVIVDRRTEHERNANVIVIEKPTGNH